MSLISIKNKYQLLLYIIIVIIIYNFYYYDDVGDDDNFIYRTDESFIAI